MRFWNDFGFFSPGQNYDRNFAAGKNGLLFHTRLGYSIKYAIKLTKPENKIRKIVVYCSY